MRPGLQSAVLAVLALLCAPCVAWAQEASSEASASERDAAPAADPAPPSGSGAEAAEAVPDETRLRLERGLRSWLLEEPITAGRDWRIAHELDREAFLAFRSKQSESTQGAMDVALTEVDPREAGTFRIEVGLWWNSNLSMDLALGVRSVGRLSPEVDVRRFLGVRRETISDFADASRRAVLELSASYESGALSLGLWGTLPYRYEGSRSTEREFELGGEVFLSQRRLDTRLAFFNFGLDLGWNVVRDRSFGSPPDSGSRGWASIGNSNSTPMVHSVSGPSS